MSSATPTVSLCHNDTEHTADGGQSRMVRNLEIYTKQFRRKLLWVALLCLGAALVFLYDRVVGGLV